MFLKILPFVTTDDVPRVFHYRKPWIVRDDSREPVVEKESRVSQNTSVRTLPLPSVRTVVLRVAPNRVRPRTRGRVRWCTVATSRPERGRGPFLTSRRRHVRNPPWSGVHLDGDGGSGRVVLRRRVGPTKGGNPHPALNGERSH